MISEQKWKLLWKYCQGIHWSKSLGGVIGENRKSIDQMWRNEVIELFVRLFVMQMAARWGGFYERGTLRRPDQNAYNLCDFTQKVIVNDNTYCERAAEGAQVGR